MNFFGHAAIAGRFEPDPVFVLGAMLPDFCGMLGLRAPVSAGERLAAGIRFHHVTDHAFHELPSFRGLNRDAVALLDRARVRRGTARAVAHVGIELLLDAVLAENDGALAHYLAALRAGQDPAQFHGSAWTTEECERVGRLTGTLAARGVAKNPSSALVTERLERALAARPRLAVSLSDAPAVRDWVELFRERVVACTPPLLGELTRDIERRLAA